MIHRTRDNEDLGFAGASTYYTVLLSFKCFVPALGSAHIATHTISLFIAPHLQSSKTWCYAVNLTCKENFTMFRLDDVLGVTLPSLHFILGPRLIS